MSNPYIAKPARELERRNIVGGDLVQEFGGHLVADLEGL